ncbi:MAG TPA: GDSL-type esterase/lipase family protein, partial [Chitinivibrionales bacterium]|nr:GDSL-type esterase/lipase family protein [Chitinivibrionales bacterium]
QGQDVTYDFAFKGLILDGGAYTLPPTVETDLIEWIGDSITDGYIDSMSDVSAYAWICAESLACEHTQIAYVGISLVNGYGQQHTTGMATQYFKLQDISYGASVNWNFSLYTPKVVVINLGTNDGETGTPTDLYQSTYITFLDSIRAKFPKVNIFVLVPNAGYMRAQDSAAYLARLAAGDSGVHYLNTTGWLTSAYLEPDGIHPNESGHAKLASLLGPFISQYLTPSPPVITPDGGTYSDSVCVTMSAKNGTIRYTLDGSSPSRNSTQYAAPLTIKTTTTVTARSFTSKDSSATATGTFVIITNGQLVVQSISPSSGINNAPVQITNLSGSNFRSGATVKLMKAGQADINATNVSVISSTQITCTIDITNASTGAWDVVVINPDTKSGTLSQGFTVSSPPPVPISPANNATNVSLTPTLIWHKATNDSLYTVQLSASSGFSPLLVNNNQVSDTSFALSPSVLSNNASYYWKAASTKKGGEITVFCTPWTFTTVPAIPGVPNCLSPAAGATNVALTAPLIWSKVTGAISYHAQIATDTGFAAVVKDSAGLSDTTLAWTGFANNTRYFWRVQAINPGGASAWSVDSFTTIAPQSVFANISWNMISFNIQPKDSSCTAIFGGLRGNVLVKNNSGQVYWHAYGINTIGNVATGQGYQLYTDTLDTIVIPGNPYNVATTPISLGSGWNMFAYLPQSSMNITTALAGITSQIIIVKNNSGQVYWPAYSINNIGTMNPGQGYMGCMTQAVALTYPNAGTPKMAVVADKTIALPLAKHYALSKNTGANATVLATKVLLNGNPAPDGAEVAAYDTKGNLVGSGVVMKGVTAFSVWGKDPRTKVKDGLTDGEDITLKVWDGSKEYPLQFSGTRSKSLAKMAYSGNAVFLGSLSVPSFYFIKQFALHGTCAGPNGQVKIMFDVPYDNKDMHNVTINLFAVSGRLVHQIASGEYPAGRYTVSLNGSTISTGMCIVQMKAESFDSKVRLMIVK